MAKVLFVCLGNICRSPMAELMFKDMLEKKGVADGFFVQSAGTSDEEEGNPVYPPARRELQKHGISAAGKYARQLKKSDLKEFDYILCMEKRNERNALRTFGVSESEKVCCLLDFVGGGDIADPWYSGNFERTYEDIERGLNGFYGFLEEKR
ncbi:MAG: low molecular weight phosphotyrosine protein phosphatase [Clostridia bacterium]|nr:low molecular weight phosphotyrosine protein phosphatase [Clostridia bacterium]